MSHCHKMSQILRHELIFGGLTCESTWLKTVLFFYFPCIDVNFAMQAYVTLGSYVLRVSTHYTLSTVYK